MSKTEDGRKESFRRTIALCASGAGSVAILALIGWATGRWELGAWGRDLLPMAPSAAGLTVLLAGTLILRQLRPSWPPVRWFARTSLLATGGMSLLIIAQALFGFESPLEGWLSPVNITIREIAVGRMSIMTALVFLLMVLAFVFESPTQGKNRLWPQLASVSSLCGLIIGLVVSLSYAAGVPLFYGGRTVPMALPTALAFDLLCAGLFLAAGPDTWPLSLFRLTYDRSSPQKSRWISGGLLSVFFFFIAAIGLSGGFYLNSMVVEHRQGVQKELLAIADQKTSQIAGWYRNKMDEAQEIFSNPVFQLVIGRFLDDPSQDQPREELQIWMHMKHEFGQWSLVLYDARAVRRMSWPPDLRTTEDSNRQNVQAALLAENIQTTDLHREPDTGNDGRQGVFIDFWIPIRKRPGTVPLGALMLRIDAARFLFPLTQSWPAPSRTAETLLLRREGDQLVYLNELRHRPAEQRQPAARAARGQEGFLEGLDYRGAAVFSALRGISGTPWFLEAKIDQDEIDAPLRERVRDDGIRALVLILAGALSISLLGRRRQESSDRERQILANRIQHLTRMATDLILMSDENLMIQEANESAQRAYGHSLAELQRLSILDICAPEAGAGLDRIAAHIASQGALVFESVHRRKDGSTFPVEGSISRVETGEQKYHIAIFRDITERKRVEESLQREHEILLTVINNVPDEIFFKDKAGRYVFVNKKKIETLGAATVDQVVGKTAFEFFTADLASRFTTEDLASMNSGIIVRNNEYKFTGSDGKTAWEITTKVPVLDAKGEAIGILGISRDITELKRGDEERRSLELQMQHSQKLESLGILAGGIAHDFNNLLMAILGNTEIALLRVPPDSPARQHMEDIRKSVHRAADLTTQMLAYSGKGNFMVRKLDMNDTIRGMAALLNAAISKKVRMDIRLAEDLPAIQADAAQIRQVAMNLITNASEAFGEDGIGEIQVETGLRDCDEAYLGRSRLLEIPPPGRYVFLSVVDTGCGMTEETKARLFDPFFTTKFLGRGLGLAAVLGIVRGHKGAIIVESEPGRGAGFTVLFPVDEEHSQKE